MSLREDTGTLLLKPGDPSAMKVGKLDGAIRGLVVVGLEVQEVWAFSCTVDGLTLFSDQSRRDCACWPHADYPDEDVDVVYAQLDLEVARSKNRKIKIVIAGDWNARVGQAQDDDDDR